MYFLIIIIFIGRMLANLKMRYGEENSEWMLLYKAAFPDPRFSRLVHLSSEQRNLISDSLSHEMKENETDNDCAQEGLKADTALGAMGSLFGEMHKSSDFSKSSDGIFEMQSYIKEAPLSPDANPLLWWRETGRNRYPKLAKLARKYLWVPGTSVRSERVFSSAGNIVNKKRAALGPDQVDRFVFLANNIKN